MLPLCVPARPKNQLHELNYRAKKSLSGIKIQGIDGAMGSLQLSIVSSPVHRSIRVLKPAYCFQVSSQVSPHSLPVTEQGPMTVQLLCAYRKGFVFFQIRDAHFQNIIKL